MTSGMNINLASAGGVTCEHLFDGCVHGELRGLSLGLAEDDGPAVAAAVHLDDITDDGRPLRPVTRDGQVLHARKQLRHGICSIKTRTAGYNV